MTARSARLLLPLAAVALAPGCTVPEDYAPDWESLPDPLDAARSCVFTTAGEGFSAGTCSPVFEGTGDWESGGIGGYDVEALDVFGGTGYLMLYTGVGGTGREDDPAAIGAAASLDGIRWTRWPDGPVIEPQDPTGRIEVACTAIRPADGTVHLWAVQDDAELLHFTSPDGTSFDAEPEPVPDVIGESGPFLAIRGCSAAWDGEAGIFRLFFGGIVRHGEPGSYTFSGEIAAATSKDGGEVEWLDGGPALNASGAESGAFDAAGVAEPGVVCQDGLCALFYVGWSSLTQASGDGFRTGDHRLGLAFSTDPEGAFTRDDADLSILAPRDDGTLVDRPRPVFANGTLMLFLQDNFGLANQPELAIAIAASPWPPAAEEDTP